MCHMFKMKNTVLSIVKDIGDPIHYRSLKGGGLYFNRYCIVSFQKNGRKTYSLLVMRSFFFSKFYAPDFSETVGPVFFTDDKTSS